MNWLNHNAAAIQAVGTLIAIAIAIWVPFKIHSNEARRRDGELRRQRQAIAVLIEPLLVYLDGQIERNDFVPREGMSPIEIPETLLELSKELWVMGEAGGHVLQLIGLLQAHNRLLAETTALPIDMEDDDRREFEHGCRERLEHARKCIADAVAGIARLMGRGS